METSDREVREIRDKSVRSVPMRNGNHRRQPERRNSAGSVRSVPMRNGNFAVWVATAVAVVRVRSVPMRNGNVRNGAVVNLVDEFVACL
ncbi:protein of unknown function [Kyrpidia spormannii]|uniref:Uncharacterized protein n=1 Tax=Kyrpidia spormannii TaxID=2055160 RepID=A0A6F9EGH9_9BACL|nr:protein of unknown function [Kyrpidia spormannii]